MELSFYDTFKQYSNVELLKVIRQPEQYQPEAVEAAQLLLRERSISPEEQTAVDQYFQDEATQKSAQSEKIIFYKEQVRDIVAPVLVPGTPLSPAAWFRLFMGVFTILYLWSFYQFIKKQIRFLQCRHCVEGSIIFLDLLNITYLSILFYLLLQKKRWGWILLFTGGVTAMISNLFQLYVLFKYRDIIRIDMGGLIFSWVFAIAMLFFLWRPSIARFFGVDKDVRLRVLGGAIIFGVVYVGGIQFL